MNAMDFNKAELAAGRLTAAHITVLVREFQKAKGFTGSALDGKAGVDTRTEIEKLLDTTPAPSSPPTDGRTPCGAAEALQRALSIVEQGGMYVYGTGDYKPKNGVDLPWTPKDKKTGSDCAGFAICWAYKLKRNRPGFNKGSWATVADDINCNSAIEDAQHKKELFRLVGDDEKPELGDLVVWPTFTPKGATKEHIGHVGMVMGIDRVNWSPGWRAWDELDIVDCHGPTGRVPGILTGTGAKWAAHDKKFKSEPAKHQCVLLRVNAVRGPSRSPKPTKAPTKAPTKGPAKKPKKPKKSR